MYRFVSYIFFYSKHTCIRPVHPHFPGLQAHPEFCMRPLNPSPPFLGFVAAASGKDVLENQKTTVKPPHPEYAMVNRDEAKLKAERDVYD